MDDQDESRPQGLSNSSLEPSSPFEPLETTSDSIDDESSVLDTPGRNREEEAEASNSSSQSEDLSNSDPMSITADNKTRNGNRIDSDEEDETKSEEDDSEKENSQDDNVYIHSDVMRFLNGDMSFDEYMHQGPQENTDSLDETKESDDESILLNISGASAEGADSDMSETEISDKSNSDKLDVNDFLTTCRFCGIKYTSAAHMDRHVDLCRGKSKPFNTVENDEDDSDSGHSNGSGNKTPQELKNGDMKPEPSSQLNVSADSSSVKSEVLEVTVPKVEATEESDAEPSEDTVEEVKNRREKIAYECELCGYRTGPSVHAVYNKARIVVHYRHHTDKHILQCEECGYLGCHGGSFVDHVMGHNTDELPLKCRACLFKTGRTSALRAHLTNHREIRAWNCDKCLYKSKRMEGLRKHYAVHYSQRYFTCPACPFTSYLRKGIVYHLSEHSDANRKFTCCVCPYKTKMRQKLKDHICSKHVDRIVDIANVPNPVPGSTGMVTHVYATGANGVLYRY